MRHRRSGLLALLVQSFPHQLYLVLQGRELAVYLQLILYRRRRVVNLVKVEWFITYAPTEFLPLIRGKIYFENAFNFNV